VLSPAPQSGHPVYNRAIYERQNYLERDVRNGLGDEIRFDGIPVVAMLLLKHGLVLRNYGTGSALHGQAFRSKQHGANGKHVHVNTVGMTEFKRRKMMVKKRRDMRFCTVATLNGSMVCWNQRKPVRMPATTWDMNLKRKTVLHAEASVACSGQCTRSPSKHSNTDLSRTSTRIARFKRIFTISSDEALQDDIGAGKEITAHMHSPRHPAYRITTWWIHKFLHRFVNWTSGVLFLVGSHNRAQNGPLLLITHLNCGHKKTRNAQAREYKFQRQGTY